MPDLHDLGGRTEHFAPVHHDADEPAFLVSFLQVTLGKAIDEFRYEIEQLPAQQYFRPYYARWLAALENQLKCDGHLADGELEAKASGQPAGGRRRARGFGSGSPPWPCG